MADASAPRIGAKGNLATGLTSGQHWDVLFLSLHRKEKTAPHAGFYLFARLSGKRSQGLWTNLPQASEALEEAIEKEKHSSCPVCISTSQD